MSLKLKSLSSDASAQSNDSGRNKPNRLLQIGVVAVVAIVVYLGGKVMNYAPSASRAMPTETPVVQQISQVITSTATPTPTMLPAMDSVLRSDSPTAEVQVHYIEVTSTPTPTPVYVYVTTPIEVIKYVTDTVTVVASPTPTPALAPGTVKICADVSGASAIYIGGLGIVTGGCQTFSFGVGQTSIQVQINK